MSLCFIPAFIEELQKNATPQDAEWEINLLFDSRIPTQRFKTIGKGGVTFVLENLMALHMKNNYAFFK